MTEPNKMRSKRTKNLIVICTLTAVVMAVSTYAWFIGMRTVNVSSFDVEIASTDSLMLSLDGLHWGTTVDINKGNFANTYDGNTNSWGGSGLVPMSSVGDMDADASRMKLFEKASLTATPGGYRLLASRVRNYELDPVGAPGVIADEVDGYVAFDLFVRNFSGHQYIDTLRPADEEAIYLTKDSLVDVALAGAGGVDGTGIENSVRVAFVQIGRVIGTTTDQDTITGINCEPDAGGNPSINGAVTGICRTAQIWEPNDTAHVDAAISWYNNSCIKRINGPAVTASSYSSNPLDDDCEDVADRTAYDTYAVKDDISSAQGVDIYDGFYNKYAGTPNTLLNPVTTFTDTMKEYIGVNRPDFMTLAPNSITKIRVYIYIEGQDIDNYDFAQIGKKISVKFGFTKERFTGEASEGDIGYTGPDLQPSSDVTKPVITLNDLDTKTVTLGSVYHDAGATASDNIDGDITDKIQVINPVDTSKTGKYTVTYNVSDAAGNYATTVIRIVNVVNP